MQSIDASTSERKEKKKAADPTPRGRSAFAASQRDKVLELLRQAGPRGVCKEDLIFKHRMTQAAARVFELEREGFVIRHESRPGERLIVFVLESEPLELKPPPSGKDWYEEKFGSRPSATPQEPDSNLPLFAGGRGRQ